MASKGQSGLEVKKLVPAKVRLTALGAFERTHDRTQEHGRTRAQLALAALAVICGRTCTLRSTTNNWCVRTQVVCSNAGQ
jgi:hypothetical protein